VFVHPSGLDLSSSHAQLAAGFGIGTTTAYRYITEAVDLLSALAPTLEQAVREASAKAFVLLDGTPDLQSACLTEADGRTSPRASRP
jgi:hypothetical protein